MASYSDDPNKKPAFQLSNPWASAPPMLGTGMASRIIADGITAPPTAATPSAPSAAAVDTNMSAPANTVDMAAGNAALAKQNAIRQSMIDSQPQGVALAIKNQGLAETQSLMDKWDRQNQVTQLSKMDPRAAQAVSHLAAAGINADIQGQIEANRHAVAQRGLDIRQAGDILQNQATTRGQDVTMRGQDVTMRGQDLASAREEQRLGIDQSRLDLAKEESQRADSKWGIEKGILQGQATDAEGQRVARAELNAAIASGDPAKVEAAKTKAIAAGIKFDKPSLEFVTTTDSNGINATRTNKDTGAVDIINLQTGAVTSIPAPGAKPVAVAAPAAAIDFLKKNPGQAAAFKAKYGYLPEGF